MRRVTVVTGGIGGAKLVHGLAQLPDIELSVIVNTGDDFEHGGLYICPDVDTTLYTLAGLDDRARGWGRRDETWTCHQTRQALGDEAWFQLGDRDLALHLFRTERVRRGERLTAVIESLAQCLGVRARVLPASDDPVRTIVATDGGPLAFQHYFVREQCRPRVRALEYRHAEQARMSPEVREALTDPAVEAIVIAPSNPYLSVGPVLAVPALRASLARAPAPVVAVSPLVKGQAVKGPTAKIMEELGMPVAVASIVQWYGDLVDTWLVDPTDAASARAVGAAVIEGDVLMTNDSERRALAQAVLDAARGSVRAPPRERPT